MNEFWLELGENSKSFWNGLYVSMRSGILNVGVYKIKILTSSENTRESPCPAVSNIQPRFNSCKDNKAHVSH